MLGNELPKIVFVDESRSYRCRGIDLPDATLPSGARHAPPEEIHGICPGTLVIIYDKNNVLSDLLEHSLEIRDRLG